VLFHLELAIGLARLNFLYITIYFVHLTMQAFGASFLAPDPGLMSRLVDLFWALCICAPFSNSAGYILESVFRGVRKSTGLPAVTMASV
jgi:hypothetical protein